MFSADCRRCQPIREGGAAGRPTRGEETDKLVLQSGLFIISTWRAAGEGGGEVGGGGIMIYTLWEGRTVTDRDESGLALLSISVDTGEAGNVGLTKHHVQTYQGSRLSHVFSPGGPRLLMY